MDCESFCQLDYRTGLVPVNAEGKNHLSTFIPDEKHRQVLKTCIDVPEESPSFPLPLERVGISGKTVWVKLADNKGGQHGFGLIKRGQYSGNVGHV